MTESPSRLRIIEPGPATTVQDLGRPAMRRLGVPVAGTLCPDWLGLANGLVGNTPDAAALEFRLQGPRFDVEGGPVLVAVGGPAEMRVTGDGEPRRVPPWTSARIMPGESVSVGPVKAGTTAILAVSGGIDTPPVLGSRATYLRAALGGFEGRALQRRDRLALGAVQEVEERRLDPPPADSGDAIRVIMGPQDDHFDPDSCAAFLGSPYRVTTNVDRMGMRLDGPELHHLSKDLSEIVSDGIVPGAIQVPGNGQPIILLADGQTVGGYPKIATVISADLPRLSRSAPGTELRFRAVSVAEAEQALFAAHSSADALLATAQPVSAGARIDLRSLYETNLISGAIADVSDTA